MSCCSSRAFFLSTFSDSEFHENRIDPLPYRTEDFTESNIFVKEILETGVKIV